MPHTQEYTHTHTYTHRKKKKERERDGVVLLEGHRLVQDAMEVGREGGMEGRKERKRKGGLNVPTFRRSRKCVRARLI